MSSNAELRAEIAIALMPDADSPEEIARVRARCLEEIRRTRRQIGILSNAAGVTLAEIDMAAAAVARWRRLQVRVSELDAMAKAFDAR